MHDSILYDLELLAQLSDDLLTLLVGVLSLFLGHVKKLLRPVTQSVLLLPGARLAAAESHEVADERFHDVVESVILSQHLQFLYQQ